MNSKNKVDAEQIRRVFVDNLTYYMRINNVSSKEISDRLSVGASTVTDWTHGKKMPRMDKIEMLADYFGVLKSDLIEKRLTAETDEEPKNAKEYELLKNFRSANPSIQELVLNALRSADGK